MQWARELEIIVSIVVVFVQTSGQAYTALRKGTPPRGGMLNNPPPNPEDYNEGKAVYVQHRAHPNAKTVRMVKRGCLAHAKPAPNGPGKPPES